MTSTSSGSDKACTSLFFRPRAVRFDAEGGIVCRYIPKARRGIDFRPSPLGFARVLRSSMAQAYWQMGLQQVQRASKQWQYAQSRLRLSLKRLGGRRGRARGQSINGDSDATKSGGSSCRSVDADSVPRVKGSEELDQLQASTVLGRKSMDQPERAQLN
jgi:hypothetical protein